MGCGASNNAINFEDNPDMNESSHKTKLNESDTLNKTQWKLIPTREEIISKEETILNEDEIELRMILADPVGQKHIGNFAKEILTAESFFCWVEIYEYQNIPSQSFRKCMAKHIYDKYLKSNARMALGGLTQEMVAEYDQLMAEGMKNRENFTDEFFHTIERLCIMDMCRNTYKLFKESVQYELYKQEIKSTYNRVTVDDFEYLDLLGSGGFGRVVHAVKKSTGKHYAMKIQLKTGLLDEHRGDLSKLASEKVVFQSCSHPYITDMHYSFQTEKYALIVLELVRGGDLLGALKLNKNYGIEEERVRLYAAEIALALNHLHEMGLLYRDLKPANVLLTEDGHIKLADMGLAGGIDLGDPHKLKERDEEINLEEEEMERKVRDELIESTVATDDANKFHRAPVTMLMRRKTTVGTKGYMAPEMLKGKHQRRSEREGYNHSVDYWSLGVTVYELLLGYPPFVSRITFPGDKFDFPVEFKSNSLVRDVTNDELNLMNEPLDFPDTVSSEAKDFVTMLLNVDEKKRLGCTEKGFAEVMDHPFFKSVNWDKLLVRHVDPTFIPKCKLLNDKPKFASFADIMHKFDMKDRDNLLDWNACPTKDMQAHFEKWDYVSPNTLKAELGIAKEMDQSNLPYKVIQLTGLGR